MTRSSEPRGVRPLRPAGTWRLARLRGIDLLIRPSLLVMAAVLIVLFSSRFSGTQGHAYLLSALFVLALYVSVLIHELAHVLVALAYRMRVASVTLHLLGGETAIEGESETPGQEFWVAFCGPVITLVISVAAYEVADATSGSVHDVAVAIGFVNLLIGIVNLLPGLPMDGGRVFRAVVWKATGSDPAGITAAAWLGRLLAVAALIWPFAWAAHVDRPVSLPDLVIGVLVAGFLWMGASQALQGADRTRRLAHLQASRLAEPPGTTPLGPGVPSLPADITGVQLLRAMAVHPAARYAVVDADGTVVGILDADRVAQAYKEGPR